jgi:uncharacterized membrane protein YfcA
MPPIEVLIFAPLVVVTAYIIFAISGFGSTLIAVPLLAHLFPLKFVIPMIVLLDCIGAISMGLRLRANVRKSELAPLLPFLVVGLIGGALLLVRLPGEVLLGALGACVLVYGGLYVTGKQPVFRVSRWAAPPVGVFAGITSAAFGIGGPIYVMYLTARGATPDQVRATVPVIFIFTTIGRIMIFTAAGLFTKEILYTAAALLPIMGLGMWIGHQLHLNMSREQLVRLIGTLLVMSGGSLLVKAAMSAGT